MPKLSVVTPIRDRPKGFELCRLWMRRQTFQDYEWIVVDDGDEQTIPWNMVSKIKSQHPKFIYHRIPRTDDPCTFPENICRLIELSNGEYWTLLEDDDWRGTEYLQGLVNEADKGFEYVVMWCCPTYHLWSRFYHDTHPNYCVEDLSPPYRKRPRFLNLHALIRRDKLSILHDSAMRSVNISKWRKRQSKTKKAVSVSTKFWEAVMGERGVIRLLVNNQIVYIKGMEGRAISGVHKKPSKVSPKRCIDDQNHTILNNWVGLEDANLLIESRDRSGDVDSVR